MPSACIIHGLSDSKISEHAFFYMNNLIKQLNTCCFILAVIVVDIFKILSCTLGDEKEIRFKFLPQMSSLFLPLLPPLLPDSSYYVKK